MLSPAPQGPSCLNCGSVLSGRYCTACGQKRVDAFERSLTHQLVEFWRVSTNVENRPIASLLRLLAAPGELTRAYVVEGARRRYMSPVALFLMTNLLFFLLPGYGLRDFSVGLPMQSLQWYGRIAQWLIDVRLASRGLSLEQYAALYEPVADDLAKSLIIVHAPFLALVQALLLRRSGWYYVDHLAGVLHFLAFVMVFAMLLPRVVEPAWTLWTAMGLPQREEWFESAVQAIVILALGAWLWGLLGRAYGLGWPWRPPVIIALLGSFWVIHILLYRFTQFLLAYALS